MNNNELKQLRKENMKLYQKNLSLLETINLNSKEFNYLKHQNREYEILNNELRQTAVRNVGFININSSKSSSNNNNGNYSNKDMEQRGDDEENLTTVAPSSTINIMDFNNLLHTQGELRSEIHKLRLLKNELDKKCRHYEKKSLKHLQHNKDDIDAVEESKMIKLTKNRHLLEINALQSSEKKLKKENLKFLKKVNDIKAVLRAKDKEHAKEIDSIQEILNSKELRIKDLIKKLKKEKSMTKYLNTRIEEASLLRHELQKEHENEILQNNSVIGQLQSKVTQLKFSNSINNEYDVDITINNVGNANSSIISNVERTTTFNLSDSNYPDIIAGSSNVKDNNNNYKEKVKVMVEAKRPRSKTGVRAWVGMINYYRMFIKNVSKILGPIYKLLHKDVPNKFGDEYWTRAQEEAFKEIKNVLTTEPVVLAHPDFEKPFEIHTDGSVSGLGAVLVQRDENGNDRVVEYASRTLTVAESHYTTRELECLALLFGCRKFHRYLGEKFVALVDHKNLLRLQEYVKHNRRLARWAVTLSQYDIELKYRKGKEHVDADMCSRIKKEIIKQY